MARRKGPHLALREGQHEAHGRALAGPGRGGLEEGLVGEQIARHRRQHRAFPPALPEPPGDARGADHLGGVDARHQAGASRRVRILALIEDGAVGREQPHADLEMPRPALDEGVDRLEQNLHALGRDGLGDARELRVELRRCAGPWRGLRADRIGVGHHAGTWPAARDVVAAARAPPRRRPALHRARRRLQRLDRAADHGLGIGGALGQALPGARCLWCRVELVGELLDQVLDQLDAHLGLRRIRQTWGLDLGLLLGPEPASCRPAARLRTKAEQGHERALHRMRTGETGRARAWAGN